MKRAALNKENCQISPEHCSRLLEQSLLTQEQVEERMREAGFPGYSSTSSRKMKKLQSPVQNQ